MMPQWAFQPSMAKLVNATPQHDAVYERPTIFDRGSCQNPKTSVGGGGMCRQGCEPISVLCLHYEWGKPEPMQLHGGYLHDDHPHGRPKTKHLVHWQGRIFGATWISHAPRRPQWFFGLEEFGHPGVAIWCPHRKCDDVERLATFDPKHVESRWHFARGWVQNCHPEGQGTSPKSKIWMNQPEYSYSFCLGWTNDLG